MKAVMGGNCWLPLSKGWALFLFSIFKMCINSFRTYFNIFDFTRLQVISAPFQPKFLENFLQYLLLCPTAFLRSIPTSLPIQLWVLFLQKQKDKRSLFLFTFLIFLEWTSLIFGEYPSSDISMFRVFSSFYPCKISFRNANFFLWPFCYSRKKYLSWLLWYISAIKYT